MKVSNFLTLLNIFLIFLFFKKPKCTNYAKSSSNLLKIIRKNKLLRFNNRGCYGIKYKTAKNKIWIQILPSLTYYIKLTVQSTQTDCLCAIIYCFSQNLTAIQTADLLNINTINRYYWICREKILAACEEENGFEGELELDKSCFVGKYHNGKWDCRSFVV